MIRRAAGRPGAASRPIPIDTGLDEAAKRQVRRDRLNARKQALTAQSSSRWASSIIGGNDDQYRLSRHGQARHVTGLRGALSTIEKRLAQPTIDTLTAEQQKPRQKVRLPKGGPNSHRCSPTTTTRAYTRSTAAKDWPAAVITSTRPGSPSPRGERSGWGAA